LKNGGGQTSKSKIKATSLSEADNSGDSGTDISFVPFLRGFSRSAKQDSEAGTRRAEARTRFPASNPPNLPLDVSSITRSGKPEVYNRKTHGNNAGFTLVEVIVVIVIIAILAAIGVPALTGYIDKANQRKLTAMGKEVMTAMQSFIVENYINREVDYDNNTVSIYSDDGYDQLFYGFDEDGDGVYESYSEWDGQYEYTDEDDPSTYEGVSGFHGMMWELTKIPLRTLGDKEFTFAYVAFTVQGQILAYLMFDPYYDIESGDGRMVGYNISPDTSYNDGYNYGTNTPPSYDPDAGFSYWKIKEGGNIIEPW
jgi:prepilin-type N-terminal cleavage/methylation domain-containing protein